MADALETELEFRLFDCEAGRWLGPPRTELHEVLYGRLERFHNSIHAQAWVMRCPEWRLLGVHTPALDFHWNDSPELLGEYGIWPSKELLDAIAEELRAGRALRVLSFNSDSDLCFEELLVPVGQTQRALAEPPAPSDPTLLQTLATLQALPSLDSPEARAQLHVYADRLQALGESHGTLAALQLGDPQVELSDEQLGSYAGPMRDPAFELKWRGGWVTELYMRGRSRQPPSLLHPLERLLRAPASACLRSLKVVCVELRGFSSAGLSQLPCRHSLRSLCLDSVTHPPPFGELPRLEQLSLRPNWTTALHTPRLRSLRLLLSAKELDPRRIAACELGAPESLELELALPLEPRPYELQQLEQLLRHPSLASCRRLVLRPAPALVSLPLAWLEGLLAASAVLEHVELRDLSALDPDARRRAQELTRRLPGSLQL